MSAVRAGRVARPGLRTVLGLSALMLVHHFALWAWTAFHRGFHESPER